MTTPIETIRTTLATVARAKDRGGSPSYAEEIYAELLADDAPTWLAELCDENEALKVRAESAEAERDSAEHETGRAYAERDAAKAGQAGAYAEIGRLQDECLRIAGERDTMFVPADVIEAFNELSDRLPDDRYMHSLASKVERWLGEQHTRAHAKASGGEHV